MRFSKEHCSIFAAMEVVLRLFNDLERINVLGKVTQHCIDEICLAFLEGLGVKARLDYHKRQIACIKPFCIADIGKDEKEESYVGLKKEPYHELKKLSIEFNLQYDTRQMRSIYLASKKLKEHVKNKAILHFGVMNVTEDRTTCVDSSVVGTRVADDLTDIIFNIAGHPLEIMPDDGCFTEAINNRMGPVDINNLQESIAKENLYALYVSDNGRKASRLQKNAHAKSKYFQEINRFVAVQPFSEFAALILDAMSKDNDQLSIPDIHFKMFGSVVQLVGTIIVNYCIYFGGTSRIKLCQQCSSFIQEKRQNAKKFCDASCRLAYANSTEQIDKRRCRDRQNKYIESQARKLKGYRVHTPVYKDNCSSCEQPVKGGQCKIVIENNAEILTQQ